MSSTLIEPPFFDIDQRDHTNISADKTRTDNTGLSEFEGNVVIEKHQLRITADRATFNKENKNLDVTGNVHVDSGNMSLDADHGKASIEDKTMEFSGSWFYLQNSRMRGHTETITAGEQTLTRLNMADITSCDPADPDWLLSADNIEIDHEEEYGSADGVVLRFMDVPFVYVPYMEFPVGDRRRSGLLMPDIGYSDARGGEFSVPWYWNIAPNQDAVIEPRFMNRRGTQLEVQHRYLTTTTTGSTNIAFLPDDDVTGEDRHQFQYRQNTRFNPQLNMKVDIQDVSDINYFTDFSNNLATSSTTHLNRSLKLNHNSLYWQASSLFQTYETIDPAIAINRRPYRRLPQLTLNGDQPLGTSGLAFTLDSEWVDFDHEDDSQVTGTRTNLTPGLYWLSGGSSWYIKPAVKFSHTQYQTVDGNGNDQDLEARNLSISSLDAGLFFERDTDSDLTQTLEPRLYYLYVPYRDQSSLPDFDTRLAKFSIAQFFRDNRFTGGDRIGDANQLTMALSTRLINTYTGDEHLRASIGQIVYFDERKVGLNNTIDDSRESDIIGELGANWKHWSFTSSVQWDRKNRRAERENFLLHYQSDNEHIFNLGLRTDRTVSEEIRQTEVSFIAPVSSQYATFGKWVYSLEDDRDVEVIGGISFDSCCWSVQILAQRRLLDTTISAEEYDNSFMIQLVLKGLGSVSGNDVSDTLAQSILGYDGDY